MATFKQVMTYLEQDIEYMRRALALAEQGRGWTSPNPMVGATLVRDGVVVGEGYHPEAGRTHAEPEAIRQAGEKARGATLYVTLEPCCHHGRTPPCVEAIRAAGVTRVVAAMADPDPRVSGRGIALLREAGVTVDVGLLETEARRLNRAYIHHRQTGKPFVTLKLAQSLDGRVATASGHSQWITGTDARVHVHRMRSESDGVLVGIGSALADDPQLTARHVKGRQPRRIVLDSLARTPLHARLLDGSAPTLVCVTDHAPGERIHALLETGAEVLILPRNDEGHVDIHALKKELGQRQIVTLMVEGGHKVATSFLRAQEVDRVVFFVAPILIGAGLDAVGDLKVNTLLDALKLDEVSVEHIGADIMITGYPVYPTLK